MPYSKEEILIIEYNKINQAYYDYDFTLLNTAMVSSDFETVKVELSKVKDLPQKEFKPVVIKTI